MTLRQFHNGLRILLSIDFDELIRAGVILDQTEWDTFRVNPHLWMIKASDRQADKLWALMIERGAGRG